MIIKIIVTIDENSLVWAIATRMCARILYAYGQSSGLSRYIWMHISEDIYNKSQKTRLFIYCILKGFKGYNSLTQSVLLSQIVFGLPSRLCVCHVTKLA